ncbi:MAG: PA2779 family protein [Armatimonadota bacterium]|nr:MAG: PA2779 family protein [Armatimonadota bacterium]
MYKLERRYAWVATATVAVMVIMMTAACAAPIPSKMTAAPQGEREEAVAQAQTALDAGGITAQLKSFGLTDEQINQRLAQLSTDELQQLATGAEAIAAGGQQPSFSTTTWLLIIVILLILSD